MPRPPRELRAFATVFVPAGERREVTLRVPRADLATYRVGGGGWVVEGGRYRVEVGASSRDIRHLATVRIAPDRRADALTGAHTLGQWLAHEQGGPLIRGVIAAAGARDPGFEKLTRNPLLFRMAKQLTVRQIVDFPGTPFTDADLERLLAEAAAVAERRAASGATD